MKVYCTVVTPSVNLDPGWWVLVGDATMVSEVDGSVHMTVTSLLPCGRLTLIESGQPITEGALSSTGKKDGEFFMGSHFMQSTLI